MVLMNYNDIVIGGSRCSGKVRVQAYAHSELMVGGSNPSDGKILLGDEKM